LCPFPKLLPTSEQAEQVELLLASASDSTLSKHSRLR